MDGVARRVAVPAQNKTIIDPCDLLRWKAAKTFRICEPPRAQSVSQVTIGRKNAHKKDSIQQGLVGTSMFLGTRQGWVRKLSWRFLYIVYVVSVGS
jgi:hypothetical protein